MTQFYYFINQAEPADVRLTVHRFRAGKSQRDQRMLTKLMFAANARKHYLSVRDRACDEFMVKLAHSLYGQSCDAYTRFMAINVRDITLRDLCANYCTKVSLSNLKKI